MPAPQTTLLIEGTFKELVEELSDYIDNLRKLKEQPEASSSLRSEVDPLLEKYAAIEKEGAEKEEQVDEREKREEDMEEQKDEVLNKVIAASSALNGAPEKEFIPAYNLLIHLIHQSESTSDYLQPICRNLSKGVETTVSTNAEGKPTGLSSNSTRFALSVSVLTTIFNTLDADEPIRFPVFSAILDVIAKSGSWDALQPQLKHLDGWFSLWQITPQKQRQLLLKISNIATEAGEAQQGYNYLVKALRTIPNADSSGDEAKRLSVQALQIALDSPTHFNFEDLTSLDSVQALRQSEPTYFQLLEIFTSDSLEDFNNFKEEHPGWVEQHKLNDETLIRKMRLLTLASLAASSGQTRSLPYKSIVEALQVPAEDVETWVIDVIRAGLVEGKLSQLNQTFLIHRSTYRVFSENQWREVAGRLDMWRASLTGVLDVIRAEKESMIQQREMEMRTADAKINAAGGGGNRRRYSRADAVDNMD
ncbi:MAG: hypothetical protein M1831_004839 [Alyxoria varia]|nr:MAG: hypothetical protein M1831_004839 [Alyxoria varia]